jgi:hypothetical protein
MELTCENQDLIMKKMGIQHGSTIHVKASKMKQVDLKHRDLGLGMINMVIHVFSPHFLMINMVPHKLRRKPQWIVHGDHFMGATLIASKKYVFHSDAVWITKASSGKASL